MVGLLVAGYLSGTKAVTHAAINDPWICQRPGIFQLSQPRGYAPVADHYPALSQPGSS